MVAPAHCGLPPEVWICSVQVADGHVRAQVIDDGVGPGAGAREGGRGLPNLSRRAESLGGFLTITPGADARGTVLTWQVPLNRSTR